MKLLLRTDVDGLGKRGDLIEVADGYGRNYLVPRGLAMAATAGITDQADSMRRARDERENRQRAASDEVAKALVGRPIQVAHRAGENGRLYGSVTANEVADAVQAETGIEIDRRNLHLDEPIRTLGTHQVTAKLPANVQFPITVEVVEA
jgi:large subunit ribosomal protein L9